MKRAIFVLGILFVLVVGTSSAQVILNEYNAVAGGNYLGGGTGADLTPIDTFFGRVEGNGGDWFELVVVGDGTALSTVDMRGWFIEIAENADNTPEIYNLQLSQDTFWSDVRAGTILTFIQNNDAGGKDTNSAINKVNNFATEGWAWSNFYLSDTTYFAPGSDTSIEITNDNTRFTVKDSGNVSIFGPAGEGIMPVSGVGNEEIFKLEENPSTLITPLANYNDGTSSTFGAPNIWSAGTITQDFSVFIPEPMSIFLLGWGGLILARKRS